MWFALTGRLLFAGTTLEEIRARHSAASGELLQSCLALDPAQRPASAGELMHALELSRVNIGKAKRSHKMAIAALITAITAGVVLASYLSRQHGQTPTAPLENTAAVRTTNNPDAYLLFLRGRKAETTDHFRDAVELYRQAFALDPTFALARARFSICASGVVSRFL